MLYSGWVTHTCIMIRIVSWGTLQFPPLLFMIIPHPLLLSVSIPDRTQDRQNSLLVCFPLCFVSMCWTSFFGGVFFGVCGWAQPAHRCNGVRWRCAELTVLDQGQLPLPFYLSDTTGLSWREALVLLLEVFSAYCCCACQHFYKTTCSSNQLQME